MKTFFVNSTVLFVSVMATLVAVEAVFRFSPYARLLPFEGLPQGYYVSQRDTGYDLAENFSTSTHRFKDSQNPVWTNAIGCFDRDFKEETSYIYLAGDSFAWGFSPFEDKWGSVLERELGTRVLKCGVPGFGTRQELAKAERTLAALPKPSMILLSYFYNDETDDAAFPNSLVYDGKLIKNLSGDPTLSFDELESRLPQFAQWAEKYCMWNMPEHPMLQRVKCFLRNHSVLYILAQSSIKSLVPTTFLQRVGIVNRPPPSAAIPEDGSIRLDALGGFIDFAREKGTPLSVVFITPEEDATSAATSTTYAKQKAYLDALGVAYFDFTDDFRTVAHATSAPLYWKEDLHFNPAGNHLLGLLLARELAPKEKKAGVEAKLKAEFGL